MQTLTIRVNNPHAFKLIEELEALRLIEVVRELGPKKKQKLSDRLAGSITSEQANRMREELQQSRDEWDRDF
ncbi:hypothetical protein [Fibrella aquatica]|uniref:hypothetical protein n=1 Tax=Fibrella aquatica TaxID=3242487 RepID=UPI0035208F3B